MRHLSKKKYFNRSGSHRKALYKNLLRSILENEKIITSESKAKYIKPEVERLITLGKKSTLSNRRKLISIVGSNAIATKVLGTLSPRYANRNGGFLRIIKISQRSGDASRQVLLTFV